MLGLRGAARYVHSSYAAAFALECAALARVRGAMGFENAHALVPFCRRVEEARSVIAAMAEHGLRRGENGLEIASICEIPANVLQIDAFAELFDGFSIALDRLAQLSLALDSGSIAAPGDAEHDEGVLAMVRLAVTGAKRKARPIGIHGSGCVIDPKTVRLLIEVGIDWISVEPRNVLPAMEKIHTAEAEVRHSTERETARDLIPRRDWRLTI